MRKKQGGMVCAKCERGCLSFSLNVTESESESVRQGLTIFARDRGGTCAWYTSRFSCAWGSGTRCCGGWRWSPPLGEDKGE
ncbi:hypothetical protein VNO80_12381 [Phaseolus coccineus]|uniref:Uncharacterized protein n=1 Tax=Phaseolus coccineus TaxID=3886 RepID=A0AAN9N685_PHACN